MNFARFCLTIVSFPARYVVHRVSSVVDCALWDGDLDLDMRAQTEWDDR